MIDKIEGFNISKNNTSDRIIEIKIKDEILEPLSTQFKNFDLTSVEYKPFIRFTLAKYFDDLSNKRICKYMKSVIKDRDKGCLIIGPENINSMISNEFLVKLSTSIAHLIGIPNHDSMSGKFYARFQIKHEDESDSYLRKAYMNMDLHTDGTYVDEQTDWVLMTKMEEKNAINGKSVLLHLDDWSDCESFFSNPIGKQNFIWSSPKSKNVEYKVKHPVFSEDENKRPTISYIDQFPEPQNMEQGIFLQNLSNSLESCKNKNIISLNEGNTILANNHFWLHGRQPFEENKKLFRELLRIRGKFC